jgi:hypothetical protein
MLISTSTVKYCSATRPNSRGNALALRTPGPTSRQVRECCAASQSLLALGLARAQAHSIKRRFPELSEAARNLEQCRLGFCSGAASTAMCSRSRKWKSKMRITTLTPSPPNLYSAFHKGARITIAISLLFAHLRLQCDNSEYAKDPDRNGHRPSCGRGGANC